MVINELLANPAGQGSDWIELYNTTDQAIDVGRVVPQRRCGPAGQVRRSPKGTILAPHAYQVFTDDRHFGNPDDPGCHEPFGLSRTGESVYLCSGAKGQSPATASTSSTAHPTLA